MNRFSINFREPNVDRFLEVMIVLALNGLDYNFAIIGAPKVYLNFISELVHGINTILPGGEGVNGLKHFLIDNPKDIKGKVFAVQYSDEYRLKIDHITDKPYEQINVIVSRICNSHSNTVSVDRLDDGSRAIIKHASERMHFDADQCQAILDAAVCITKMDNAKEVRAEHIAEAVMYVRGMADFKRAAIASDILALMKDEANFPSQQHVENLLNDYL